MNKWSFKNNEKSQKCTKKMPIFHGLTILTERMSMKPIYLCSTFNFWSLDTYDTLWGGVIILCTCTGQIRLSSPIVKACLLSKTVSLASFLYPQRPQIDDGTPKNMYIVKRSSIFPCSCIKLALSSRFQPEKRSDWLAGKHVYSPKRRA